MSSCGHRFLAGDCFVITGYNAHLWMVISDPDADCDNVVIVNVTTFDTYKDKTCVLDPDDHPWIKHRSCVNFSGARQVSTKQLTALEAGGKLLMEQPLSFLLYRQVFLKAAIESQQIPKPYADLR